MLRYVWRDLMRNPRRTLASVLGVTLGVGLFSGILFFVDGSEASMTRRALAPLAIDMQVVMNAPLGRGVELDERLEGPRRGDAERLQPAGDALAAPAVKPPPVLREAPRICAVVEVAGPLELGHGGVGDRPLHALALEMTAHLGHRAVAVAEPAVGQVQRVGDARAEVLGAGPQVLGGHPPHAATMAGTPSGAASSAPDAVPSRGTTRSRSRPSAA